MSDIDDLSKSMCPLPWMHLSFNTDTSLRVCCNTNHGGNIKDDSGKDVFLSDLDSTENHFNHKTHRELRVAMLKGERPNFCDTCYKAEEHGGFSIRNQYLKEYNYLIKDFINQTSADGSIPEEHIKIRKIDLSLSNLCSLKCRMCDPLSSSALKKEFNDLKIDYPIEYYKRASEGWKFEKALFNIFNNYSTNLEQLLTTGGEPFISKVHKDILTFLVANNISKNIVLVYHTSLAFYPSELISLWKNFKLVTIHLSLEGIQDMNDYARYPSKWSDILINIEKLNSLKEEINFSFEIHSCIQALSWLRHHELLTFFGELRKMCNLQTVFPYPIWLENPSELSIAALPKDLQLEGAERVRKAILKIFLTSVNSHNFSQSKDLYQRYNSIIQRIKEGPSDPVLFDKFKEKICSVDILRRQNILDVVPEFKKYF